ncbi:coiled-coil domain-containing protein 157-like [Haliotis rubra]|uniref:coiled-coil domain-containing protein 157-like n=1 Tax=Haliotis rubra TaxID=36100 RepID=UPI001EE5B290|nr:coiled-coil domain-containing protein 157-like [Haliotis rubra]
MAYLLGSKACMESLRNDVQDLQWAINDVFSRTGPVSFPSWKFPDKKSWDLDIDELLELYDYSEDEEERQVAHIALYELVIDRMVLLMQSMGKYTEQLMASVKTGGENSSTSSSSVGLVVKKYWNRLIQLHTVVQQTQSENKSKSRKYSDLENTISKLTDELSQLQNGTSYQRGLTPPKTPGFGGLIPPNNADLAVMRGESVTSINDGEISKDACNKSSQTIETVFVPCESCHAVQKCFREAGDVIINTCQSQNMPSSLKKFRSQVVDVDWLSSNDVKRWTAEQNKDIARISKHVDQLAATIGPLQEDVAGYVKEKRKMNEKVVKAEKDLKTERETQSAVRRQFEVKVTELEKQHAEMLSHVTQEKEELKQSRSALEAMLAWLKEELQEQQQQLQQLENTKQDLQSEVDRNKATSSEVSSLESEVRTLKTQLSGINEKLEKTHQDLSKEQAKNRSVAKHGQSLQGKQDALLQRVGDLDQENQDLRDQVSLLEEEKEAIEESLTAAKTEAQQLDRKIKEKEGVIESLNSEKTSLKKSIADTQGMIERLEKSLEEAKERERMIIEYPDLNGPVNPDYQGTGDIVTDMQNQVRANSMRIQVLEDQNEGLRNSITKVLTMTQGREPPGKHQQVSGPAPLWKTEALSQYREDTSHADRYYQENQNNNSSSKSVTPEKTPPKTAIKPKEQTFVFDHNKTKSDGEFLVTKSSRPNSAVRQKDGTKQGRPPSGKGNPGRVMAPANATSISAYIQMKKSGYHNNQDSRAAQPPPSGKARSQSGADNSGYSPPDMFVCADCDKMYSKQRDLEIHKSYCTGGH